MLKCLTCSKEVNEIVNWIVDRAAANGRFEHFIVQMNVWLSSIEINPNIRISTENLENPKNLHLIFSN